MTSDNQLPKTCIIGAGTSGVICAKVMKQYGLPYDCFEMGSGIGGLWRFKNDNGASTCYRSLHINTGKPLMVLSDFPFADNVPEYPSHTHILEYFESYADHFDVRRNITFRTRVARVEKQNDESWLVELETGDGTRETRHYDAVVVANGHHWDPRIPDYPGEFDGIQIHSHHYVDTQDPHDLKDKNVVVVGMGNSAMDIACELAHYGQGAKKVFLSQRSGVWILPKLLGNTPQDAFLRHPMAEPTIWEHFRRKFIPRSLRLKFSDALARTILKMSVGSPSRVGLKDPECQPHERHPTISQEIHTRLIHGDITPKPNVKMLKGRQVEFADGTVEDVDAIIWCTGYNITFPFFDESFIAAPNNSIPLWQRIWDPEHPGLMFLALVQPLCAMMPIAELQSHVMASFLTGQFHLPAPEQMRQEMIKYDQMMKDLYVNSPSYTIQIDCPEYTYFLRQAWSAGKKRARAAGNMPQLPVGLPPAGGGSMSADPTGPAT